MDAFDRVMGGGGSSSGYLPAPKGKRILSDLFDLILVPIVLGLIAGFLLLNANEAIRGVIMIALNVIWLVVRDAVFAPGRAIVGIKLISETGSKVTITQALIRNILLIIPLVLILGYIIELISVLSRDNRLADKWAKTRVVA